MTWKGASRIRKKGLVLSECWTRSLSPLQMPGLAATSDPADMSRVHHGILCPRPLVACPRTAWEIWWPSTIVFLCFLHERSSQPRHQATRPWKVSSFAALNSRFSLPQGLLAAAVARGLHHSTGLAAWNVRHNASWNTSCCNNAARGQYVWINIDLSLTQEGALKKILALTVLASEVEFRFASGLGSAIEPGGNWAFSPDEATPVFSLPRPRKQGHPKIKIGCGHRFAAR